MAKMITRGTWISEGPQKRRFKNQLQQAAFDMIGSFFVNSQGPRPTVIGLADSTGEIFVFRQASFSFEPPRTGVGVTITGVAAFGANEVTEDVHFLILGDNEGNVLAETPVVPPFPASRGLRVTRTDFFEEVP
jgi:hypothetical protein